MLRVGEALTQQQLDPAAEEGIVYTAKSPGLSKRIRGWDFSVKVLTFTLGGLRRGYKSFCCFVCLCLGFVLF